MCIARCFPASPLRLGLSLALLLIASRPGSAWADVVVIANRTGQDVSFELTIDWGRKSSMRVLAGRMVAVPLRGRCELSFPLDSHPARYQLDANAAYFLAEDATGRIDLHQIDLGGTEETFAGRALGDVELPQQVGEIPVKILVDNHDPRVQAVWEPRLRRRVEEVSDILEQHCRLRLKVVAVDQWDAGKEPLEFAQSFHVFQRQVDPQPARLAIGFTGRYGGEPGRVHLGSTTGMLESHILVREWSANMTEPERTEVLLHEMGHFLGAVHSPDSDSVMRPILADSQALRRQFRIGFDPVNTVILNLVSEEIRATGADSIKRLSPGTRLRLSQIYGRLAKSSPGDNSAQQFQFQLGMVGDTPLADSARQVVRAVRRAAGELVENPAGTIPARDRLTEYYVRRAAAVSATLPDDLAACALLLGLGIALDDTDTLLRTPMTSDFCQVIETPEERRDRCRSLGSPTLLGRRDLARHFFLSAYLTAIVGAPAAESAGVVKELADTRAGSGWSYADLAANLAGTAFAQRLLNGDIPLNDLAHQFRVVRYMPTIEGLPEGLRWEQLAPQLIETERASFVEYRQEILRRIEQLAGLAVGGDSATP